ncbi:6-phosphogluconolactonase [Dysgonomonas sp. PFB1-18]|uniref:lactonase family protein n=1 Tax=unclassified Dysgonomonas TaxID=2630389 RepID=UPI002475E176|nr:MULTISPECIES: lactonase family protein [unclassified Dysgonomonas]MDH6309256.1 6-phosphogluconolactonase [Dysgonomonas sp. PF1-14]MDH6338864.1 6-phosphogluconolactonase [Dysgonomonas sp. PF1-16]MDH6380505.1 6-phosphogluconolactonase [Dysgonomonas sp. PFB1-18]MDH6397692.1 6-phosphogluconolactonase [Dysgonomonas sp. PF1-23]
MRNYFFLAAFIALAMLSCNGKNKNAGQTAIDMADTTNVNMESISDNNSMYLLVGTYTGGESEGIYVYQFDTVSGYSQYKSVVKISNPSFLAVSKDEKYVYAVSEDGNNAGAASAFAFDKKDGSLKLINSQLTGGDAPCYIIVDDAGKHVVTANYSGGSITLFDTKEDGSLNPAAQVITFQGKGVDTERQKQPHLHCVKYSPDGKYLFADDLGTDKVHKFDVNNGAPGSYLKVGTPAAFKVADASGPRHLTFHPNGKYAYLINELSGAVIGFAYDSATGNLTEMQSIQADTLNAKGSADIHVSPDGKFLYASNRLKGDGLAIFSVNEGDGKLTKVGYQETGVHPRNFVITPNGKYLLAASRDSDVIQIFLRNQETGLLEDTFRDIRLDMPVCLKFASLK